MSPKVFDVKLILIFNIIQSRQITSVCFLQALVCQVGQLAVQLGVFPWVLRSLPLLLGTVMLLRLLDAQASSPGWISVVDRVKTTNLESWICKVL